jgi:hypothetical protein
MQRLYEDTSVEGLTPWQSRGTYEMCTTVLKVIEPPRDGDPRYDYYAVRVQTRWSNDPGAWHGDRQGGRVTIRSNWEARVKDASGDLVDTNCTELPLAVAFKFVSLSITPRICDNAIVTRTRLYSDTATWETKDITKTPTWDNVYFQRVGEGFKPQFTVMLEYPQHRIDFESSIGPNSANGLGVLKTEVFYQFRHMWMRVR